MAFDRDYYQRFYFNPRTAVTSRAEMRARARLIAGCVEYVGLPVRQILDAGCGVGMLRAPLRRACARPATSGSSSASTSAAATAGTRARSRPSARASAMSWSICYDVLQYLPAPEARAAIANLARLCCGALYFGALTTEDWQQNCDRSRTDRIPGLRPGAWYRRQLARAFRPLGCGMWLKRNLDITLWNLDVAA